MRCKNCGWENPDGSCKCERCSSPLENSVSPSMERHNDNRSEEAASRLRSTVREASGGYSRNSEPFQSPVERQQASMNGSGCACSKCGYELSPSMNVCPQCGTPQKQAPVQNREFKANKEKHCSKCGGVVMAGARFCPTCGQQLRNSGTVNAWDNPQSGDFCSLRPISWSRENTQYNAISYSGERIVLNRANTDPNNQSITSHEQAVLTHDGKDWYIEDMSEQHSTMLRVSRKMKLQSGDVIALGNRLFEFQD